MSKAFREEAKRIAKAQGYRLADLFALSVQNDPFAQGSKGQLEKADWFLQLWEQFGYTQGIHLRRMHYQLISQDSPMMKPNGTPYMNTLNDWSYLNAASKTARYLGLVDPNDFVDRRNPEPIVYAEYLHDSNPRYEITQWGVFDVQLPTFPDLPEFMVRGYDDANLQPYHLEIWVEKTTMNDVLQPLCDRFGINLITGMGELSITAVMGLLHRIKRADRPCRIFYISDFDPAGYGMPISIARKIEFFLHNYGLGFDVRLEPIALTRDQVIEYELPRMPIKPTEMRRGTFEDAHGEGAVELDALEALHPGELAKTIQQAIDEYHDADIQNDARKARRELRDALEQAHEEALADLKPELDELRATFDIAIGAFETAIADIRGRLPRLYNEAEERLGKVDVDPDDYPLPETKEADESDNMLYTSERDYSDQLHTYKLHRAGRR